MADLAKPYSITNAARQSEDIDRMLEELYRALSNLSAATSSGSSSGSGNSGSGSSGSVLGFALDGIDGIDGLNGLPGAIGASGVTGAAGLDGVDGNDGLDGLPGPTGPSPNFTTGSVVFESATASTLGQDNANFFWASGTKRLGIGTASPTTTLTVDANTVALPTPTAGAVVHFGQKNATETRMVLDGFGTSPVHPDLILRRASNTAASPSAVLVNDVIGEVSAIGYGDTGYASDSRGGMQVLASQTWGDTGHGTYLLFGTTTNDTTAWTERMRITHDGRVAINTSATAPQAFLDIGVVDSVWANFRFHMGRDDGGAGVSLTTANASASSSFSMERYRGTHASKLATVAGDVIGRFDFGGYTTSRQDAASIVCSADTGWGDTAADSPGRLEFWTTPDGSGDLAERVRIHNSGGVSIGNTTDPGNKNLSLAGKATTYNAIATAGWGVPAVYGSGRSTAQTAAVASVAAYTVGAADGSFLVSMNVLMTAFTAGTISGVITYTDEGNTARSLTMNFSSIAGTLATTIGATGAFEGVPLHIRVKASTAITVTTTASAFTGTYNVEGAIVQLA